MLLGGDIVLSLDRIHSANVARDGGRDVLLYRPATGGGAEFLGIGRPAALRLDTDRATCEVENVRPFADAIPAEPDAAWEAGTVEISDERFDDVVAAGSVPDIGFAEAAATFEHAPGVDVRAEIYHQVLERWDFRCAITGERFPGATAAHDDLQVVAIRPRENNGPLHVRNYMPMVADAASLWRDGLMAVTDDLLLAFVFDSVPPALLRRIPSGFRLIVPEDRELGPDPEHLIYHRQHIFGAR